MPFVDILFPLQSGAPHLSLPGCTEGGRRAGHDRVRASQKKHRHGRTSHEDLSRASRPREGYCGGTWHKTSFQQTHDETSDVDVRLLSRPFRHHSQAGGPKRTACPGKTETVRRRFYDSIRMIFFLSPSRISERAHAPWERNHFSPHSFMHPLRLQEMSLAASLIRTTGSVLVLFLKSSLQTGFTERCGPR